MEEEEINMYKDDKLDIYIQYVKKLIIVDYKFF